ETSTYTIQLPVALQERHIHLMFHVSLIRLYHLNNDTIFPNRSQPDPYDFGAADDAEWFVNEIIGHRWMNRKLEFKVHWSLGDMTWELASSCNDLAALDRYLEVMGVKYPRQLSRQNSSACVDNAG
ncbi:hypothetical protein ARMSODRAFT_891955, partial [Armillaria solidipes]